MDDNSTNGTQVNGLYINEPVLLNDGDEITLGIPDRMGAVLRFHTQVVDMKEQEVKTETPAPTKANGKAPVPAAPVRAQSASRAKSVDVMDNILTEIAEKKDKSYKPNIASSEEEQS
jgi:pSer/pThr/pTyr-binding forkhead associated (FHA) protein